MNIASIRLLISHIWNDRNILEPRLSTYKHIADPDSGYSSMHKLELGSSVSAVLCISSLMLIFIFVINEQ